MNKLTVKLLSGSVALLLGACGGKVSKGVDSAAIRDSIARVEAEAAAAAEAAEQARLDSIRQDSIQKAEELRIKKEKEGEQVISFLRTLYSKYLLRRDIFVDEDGFLRGHLTKSLLKRLVKINEDWYGDNAGGYPAYVELSYGEECRGTLVSIDPQGDDWYKVKYSISGYPSAIMVKASVVNGRVMISNYKK